MWPFSSSVTLKECGFFKQFTECHCHLLPGVDDGAQCLEDTLKLLSMYETLGVSEMWLTPHIMEDMPNHPSELKRHFMKLTGDYHGKISLHLAAEHMLDNLFLLRLVEDNVLPIGDKQDMLLVETSFFSAPMNFHYLLQQIYKKGYYVMLAHPERYRYMDESDYRELKNKGIRFQLNLPSLTGMYGKTVKAKAERLLKLGFYDFVGCDTHRLDQLTHLSEAEIRKKIVEKVMLLTTFS